MSAGSGWGEQGSSGFGQAKEGGSGWGKIERNVGVFCRSGKTERSAFESCVNLSLCCPRQTHTSRLALHISVFSPAFITCTCSSSDSLLGLVSSATATSSTFYFLYSLCHKLSSLRFLFLFPSSASFLSPSLSFLSIPFPYSGLYSDSTPTSYTPTTPKSYSMPQDC